MEFKTIKAADVSVSERKITGYAASFGNVDKVQDIIKAGAFKKTLRERGKAVKLFYNHQFPIGKPEVMREEEKGLYTESKVSATARGDEVLQLVKDGVITDMSIGYEVIDFGQDNKTGIRTLKEIRLYEFGPVDFGANEQAVITGVKSLADSIRESQRLDPSGLAALRRELKSLMDAIEHLGGEPVKPTPPEAGPSIDTRLERLPEEITARLAAAFRIKP
jgi:HK97 family phage prohead protease